MWPARSCQHRQSEILSLPHDSRHLRDPSFCVLSLTISYPQGMQRKTKSSYRLVPRKPPTLEILLSAVADAQKLVAKGRVTKRDVKFWESKYLQLRRLE